MARVHDRFQVWVRAGTAPARARWLVGHELGEWWYRDLRLPNRDKEQLCDAFGAALILPAPLFRRGLERFGLDLPVLASRLKTTQSLTLLRYGEVTGCPVALLRPRWATVRGSGRRWPDGLTLARSGYVRAAMRAVITDEPQRIGFLGV